MKIVIAGGGKVGVILTELLSNEGHDVTVIDTAAKTVEAITNNYDVIGFCGNGASFAVQSEAGVAKSDIFIAVTGSDELNIMSCMVARSMGAAHTVARVRSPEYSEQMSFMRDKLGLGLIINPDFESADEISRIIEFPAATKIETFSKGRIELAEITVLPDSILDGLMLCDLPKNLKIPVLVCAVQRGDEVIIPGGSFVIRAGDRIHFTASKLNLPRVFKTLHMNKKKIRSVMLVGGSRTSYYLARHLLKAGIRVTLIESDPAHAAKLNALLDGASIVCGDGTDSDLLLEEGLSEYDATVALTDIDEENIILSLFAAKHGVAKTVCKINRTALIDMVPRLLQECSVVSPKSVMAGVILRYVRSIANADGSHINILYRILDGQAEAMEFTAAENCRLIGTPLKDCAIRPNIIVACISRGGAVIIPDGSTVVQPGDDVIVITTGRQVFDLNDILV